MLPIPIFLKIYFINHQNYCLNELLKVINDSFRIEWSSLQQFFILTLSLKPKSDWPFSVFHRKKGVGVAKMLDEAQPYLLTCNTLLEKYQSKVSNISNFLGYYISDRRDLEFWTNLPKFAYDQELFIMSIEESQIIANHQHRTSCDPSNKKVISFRGQKETQ